MCVPITERVDHKCSFDNAYRKIMTKCKTMWILGTVAVLLIVSMALQNYTVNQYVRAILKLTVMQVIQLYYSQ